MRRQPTLAAVTALDHVTIAASNLPRSLAFYDAVLGALGLDRLVELVDEEEDKAPIEAVAWGAAGGVPLLWLVTGETRGVHVCLRTYHRADVETFHAAAVKNGGTSHAAPRRWTPYRRGEFGATVRDPDGNLVEAVAPE